MSILSSKVSKGKMILNLIKLGTGRDYNKKT
jgi:hypothetical protein